MTIADLAVARLGPQDVPRLRALNALFAAAFAEPERDAAPAGGAWLATQLARPELIVLVAEAGGRLVGRLVAHLLPKLEQGRPEAYLYDLAVAAALRRQGVATALIATLADLARAAGATSLYVQADPEDTAAVALYTRLGSGRDVLHFDLALPPAG